MSNKQETLIYIEKDNCTEAEFMSRNFVNKELKNRAYINALGVELVTKYLTSEGIKTSNIHNIHSVSKILENIDIADILLPNIHLDVRVVFDEKQIFIPKTHFEMEILPDAYVVLKLNPEFKHVELLGYFKPSQINKHNENSEYYFFDKDKLSSPNSLTKFVKEFIGKTSRDISEADLLKGRELAVSLADHNISISEEKELLELLLLSDELRESVLEFDNFETLSYSTAPVLTESLTLNVESKEIILENDANNSSSDSEEEIIEEDDDSQGNGYEEDSRKELEEEDSRPEISLATMSMNEELDLDDTFSESDFVEPTLVESEKISETEKSDTPHLATETSSEEDETIEETVTEEEEEEKENFTTEDDDTDKTETDILQEIDFSDNDFDVEIEPIDEIDLIEDNTPENDNNKDENIIEDIQNEEVQDEELLDNLNGETLEFNEEPLLENISETDFSEIEEPTNDTSEISEEEHNDNQNEETEEITDLEDVQTLNIEDEPTLNLDQTDLGDDLLGGDLLDENNEIITPEIKNSSEETIEEHVEIEEPLTTPEEKYIPQTITELSVDSILDQTIASISETTHQATETNTEEKEKEEKSTLETDSLEVAATSTAEALAKAVAKAEDEQQENTTASDEAIKLASVSGDMINNMVQNLEVEQQKNLDKIDYAKTDITTEIDVPDHLLAVTDDLSLAKMEGSIVAELSGEFCGPTDLDNLNKVKEYQEQHFEQESIDFDAMETISEEELLVQGNENQDLDLDNLSNINIDMSAGANLLPDINLDNNDIEEGVVNLPQFNTGGFEINEDGTSPMDAMVDMNLGTIEEEEGKENLMDMDLSGETSPLDENELDFSSCIKPSTRQKKETSENNSTHTIDEATKQSLLANKITKDSGDDDSFSIEDFGETIIIDEDEPFVMDSVDITTNETSDDEISLEDFIGEDELTEESSKNIVTQEEDIRNTNEELNSAQDYQEITSDTPADTSSEQQDWMNDTDYTNLEDIEIQSEEIPEDFITEPTAEEKTYTVIENSTVISDKTFKAGEIPIDINAQNNQTFEGDESLESIYNSNSKIPGGAMLQTPGKMSTTSNNQGRAAAGILGLVGTLIVLVLVGAIGFGVAKLFKNPTEEAPQPITDEPLPTSSDNGVGEVNTLKINPDNVVNMDNNTNALATTTPKSTQAKKQSPATVNTSTSQRKGPAKPFVSITKLTWSLPNYISNSPQFKQYFQSAGKSLKLSLTSDLLLATDYLYSNTMRVGLTFAKDGTFQDAQIITSSGSNQIDKIVLQTVNQVLKTLKAPHSVGNEENTPVTLNLYF